MEGRDTPVHGHRVHAHERLKQRAEAKGGVPALLYASYFRELRKAEVRRIHLPRTQLNKPPVEPLIRWFIRDSSLYVPLLGMSATRLNNASFQASYTKHHQRLPIVARLLAEGSVLLLLMASGWWGITTLGSNSIQQMREPIYVAGCPLSDTALEKGSAGGGCSKEGVSHPISTRQPGGGLGSEPAHGAERPREDKAPPQSSQIAPSKHSGE